MTCFGRTASIGFVLLSSGCVEVERSYQLPDVDAPLAVLYGDDGDQLRPLGGPWIRDTSGEWQSPQAPPSSLLGDEKFVAAFLDEAALAAIHPLIDRSALTEVAHLPPVTDCGRQRSTDGRAEAPLPPGALLYVESGGELSRVSDVQSFVERASRLSFPLVDRPCETGLSARRFGSDWSVMGETFEHGDKRFDRTSEQDGQMFEIRVAHYLDPDRVVVATGQGVFVLERGEILRTSEGALYWSVDTLPEAGAPELRIMGMELHPVKPAPDVTRVMLSILLKPDGNSESRILLLDISDGGINLVKTASVAGEVGSAWVEEQSVLTLVNVGATPELRGRKVVGFGPDGLFEQHLLEQSFRQISSTGRAEPRHVGHAFNGSLIVGDVFTPSSWRTIRGPDDGSGSYRGMTSAEHDGGLEVFLGSVSGELLAYDLDGEESPLPVFLDSEVLEDGCRSARETCGYPDFAPFALRLAAFPHPRGSILSVLPNSCRTPLAARAKVGCFGVLDVGQDPVSFLERATFLGVFQNEQRDRGLITGGSGALFEVFVDD